MHETESLTDTPPPSPRLCGPAPQPHPPTSAGDINYVLRFHNTDKGVIVEDLQNNNVTLSKPVLINSASIIVIDRVLMSGELSSV